MKTLIYIAVTVLFVLLISAVVIAQPGLPGGHGGIEQVPIDSGLGLLAAAGAGYAIKKLRNRRINEDPDL